MNEKKFFIKDNLIFSGQNDEISLIIIDNDLLLQIENIKPSYANITESNEKIISTLNNSTKPKIVKTFKTIENIETVKRIIEENFSKNKNDFQKPKSNDYEFTEITSQMDILENILKTISSNDSIQKLINMLNSYEQSAQAIEKSEISKLNDEKNIVSEELKQLKNENLLISKPFLKSIEELNKKKNNLTITIENLEKSLNQTSFLNPENEELRDIIDKLEKEKKEYEFRKKELHEYIKELKIKSRMGKKKIIFSWPLFIITLGLIYWTRFCNIKYNILRLESKIANIDKKITKKEKDIFEYKDKLEELEKTSKTQQEDSKIQKNKINEALKEKKYELNQIIKEISNIEIKITKTNLNPKNQKNILELEDKLKKIDNRLNLIKNNSIEIIKSKKDEINNEYQKTLKIIKNKIDDIKKQTTKIKGSFILNIKF